jgi:hypothetical protein
MKSIPFSGQAWRGDDCDRAAANLTIFRKNGLFLTVWHGRAALLIEV